MQLGPRLSLTLVVGLWVSVSQTSASSEASKQGPSTDASPSGATDPRWMGHGQASDAALMAMRLPAMLPLELSNLPPATGSSGHVVADATGRRFLCTFQRLADILEGVNGQGAPGAETHNVDTSARLPPGNEAGSSATAARPVSQAARTKLSLGKWIQPVMPTRLGRDGRPTTAMMQTPASAAAAGAAAATGAASAATPKARVSAQSNEHQDGKAVTSQAGLSDPVNAERDLERLKGHCQRTTPG